MTQTDADDIDWQHPEVITRTVAAMMTELGMWREEKERMGRLDKDTRDVTAALRFAGLDADGFQMARYLEDSRLWPADERLVKALMLTKALRANAISDLRQERAPKPEVPEFVTFPLETTYFSDGSTIYKVTSVLHTTDDDAAYRVEDMTGMGYTVGHNAIKKLRERHGVPKDSW